MSMHNILITAIAISITGFTLSATAGSDDKHNLDKSVFEHQSADSYMLAWGHYSPSIDMVTKQKARWQVKKENKHGDDSGDSPRRPYAAHDLNDLKEYVHIDNSRQQKSTGGN